jgi:hypothetical protein
VACTEGRPKPKAEQDRRLFAESAGTCLLCNATLFPSPGRITIAERAHVVAHSAVGPRGDSRLSSEDRSDPANIVLLCPNCHTQVDKDPEAYPTEWLLARKAARATAVAMIGGTPTFSSRATARRAVESILERNRIIFQTAGPGQDGSLPTIESAARWSQHVLDEIVPGNELIVAIVQMNDGLASSSDRTAAELLRLHTKDLAAKHRGEPLIAPARRFPETAVHIFAEES